MPPKAARKRACPVARPASGACASKARRCTSVCAIAPLGTSQPSQPFADRARRLRLEFLEACASVCGGGRLTLDQLESAYESHGSLFDVLRALDVGKTDLETAFDSAGGRKNGSVDCADLFDWFPGRLRARSQDLPVPSRRIVKKSPSDPMAKFISMRDSRLGDKGTVTYPREVPAPQGLPHGWKCMEYVYQSGGSAGKTYLRFTSPDGRKGILSVKAAIIMDAEIRGLSSEVALKVYDNIKEKSKEQKRNIDSESLWEQEGRKDVAHKVFLAKHEPLDGPTCSRLPGWTVERKPVPSGQVKVTYVDPQGKRYHTVKAVEINFGLCLLDGHNLVSAEVEEARASGAPQENMLHDDQLVAPFAERGSTCLPAVSGRFSWIRFANSPEDRELRREAAGQTTEACQQGGYCFDGARVQLRHVQAMVLGTRIVRPPAVGASALVDSLGLAFSEHAPGQLLAVAAEQARRGHKVAAVSAASAYHVGGGFVGGGRHALEEAVCTQTTLFGSLLAAEAQALHDGVQVPPQAEPQEARDGGQWQCHIPEDGVVVSPHVELFRGSSGEGYPFWREPIHLAAVVSVAMPNGNTEVRDAPVDVPADREAYRSLLRRKFRAVTAAVEQVAASTLVVPDVGCGVYKNDPADVGEALGLVLREGVPPCLREVCLVGGPAFAAAVRLGAKDEIVATPPGG